ncbi:non-specific lipid-transfer protein-like protein [Canna indica]|uniref:Non-specific lipid-transfer protein-like protein n=1 Tax=Canna indica TaxID=4628 RepID=A0AAQ3KWA1_9LILI|nr:non-specific lipid-transfer protein-like protein [Canna indica]
MPNTSSAILSLYINLFLLSGARSQSPAPAPSPSPDCAAALRTLSPCSTYVEAGSNLTRPKKGCCGGLEDVLDAEPGCLCRLIDNYDGFGVRVDTTRVLMLLTACRVDAPPASLCAVVGLPIASLPPSRGLEEAASSASAAPAAAPPRNNNGGLRFRETLMESSLLVLPFAAAIF